jgi:N-methylhydantoinase A/oxoprolinase/acetone carboxylase beta subunit
MDDEIDLDALLEKRHNKSRRVNHPSEDDEEDLESKRLEALRKRKSPPTFLSQNQEVLKRSRPIHVDYEGQDQHYDLVELFDTGNRGQLKTALHENTFSLWHAQTSILVPTQIADTLYQVIIAKDKTYSALAGKACEVLTALIRGMVST